VWWRSAMPEHQASMEPPSCPSPLAAGRAQLAGSGFAGHPFLAAASAGDEHDARPAGETVYTSAPPGACAALVGAQAAESPGCPPSRWPRPQCATCHRLIGQAAATHVLQWFARLALSGGQGQSAGKPVVMGHVDRVTRI
jgi:hypothetical protein